MKTHPHGKDISLKIEDMSPKTKAHSQRW